MNRRRFLFGLALLLLIVPVMAFADAGSWSAVAAAPVAPLDGQSAAWTGRELIVYGRVAAQGSGRTGVAAAYNPASGRWRRLPSPGLTSGSFTTSSVWTGSRVLVWGQGTKLSLDPRTDRWHALPDSKLLSVHDGFGLVAWTGRELVGWGGGCCGDAFSDGVAYSPRTNTWRALPRSPLAGSQHPIGAWTGHQLLVLVGDRDPDGHPWPARLARAASYDPVTNRWRRLAPPPEQRYGPVAVWDGQELLVVGGITAAGALARVGFAYDPAANRWRQLAPLPAGRVQFAAVWSGTRLLVWGGSTRLDPPATPRAGLTYDPATDRWSTLPAAPALGRLDPIGVLAGRRLIVWGGQRPKQPLGSGTRFFADGAVFTPAS